MIALSLAVVAFLYGAVGHAGATGYIAVFALAGLAPEQIRPTALLLNVVVASLGSWQFWRAGHLQWRQFWPLLPLAVPRCRSEEREAPPPRPSQAPPAPGHDPPGLAHDPL